MMNKFWQLSIWQPPRFVGFKICAVLIALLLWIYVMGAQHQFSEDTFTVPIEMRNLSSELAIPETNRQVTVRLQGNSVDIKELASRDIVAYVDFEGVEAGEAELPVIVELPAGQPLTLLSKTPESIAFTLEPVVTEPHQLTVRINGEPAENYTLLEAVPDPAVITLSGAAQHMRNVATVYVAADVSALEANYSQKLSVEVLDANGNNISDWFTISPATAEVLIPVVYDQPEKSIAVREVLSGEPALGYQVSRVVVQPSTVRAFGDLDVLNQLYYLYTAPVDVTDLKKTTSMTATIQHGNNISLSSETVTVVVQIEPVATAEFTKELLYAQNMAEGLECAIPSLELIITVAGPDTYINSVTAADIVPYLDFSGVTGPGEYTLPIAVNLPANISLAEVSPATATVTVTVPEVEEGGEGEAAGEGQETPPEVEPAEGQQPLAEQGE